MAVSRSFRGLVCLAVASLALRTSDVAVAWESTKHPLGDVQVIEFEDIVPGPGLLQKRARYTYDLYRSYTPQHVLSLNYSNEPSDHAFPGDTIGRFIMSATLLSRALHQPEPDNLKEVMATLPSMLNAEGYLGWVLPKDRADETGLANYMWSNGLTEYYLWTKSETALNMNRTLFREIILPVKDAYYYYYSPERNDGKIQWVHCTGDVAQAFGIIDPATRGYPLFPSGELKSEIDELIRLYAKLDHAKVKAQVHATLYATRGILRWYEIQHDPAHLQLAEGLYRKYRDEAMTENYENFNWFGRPEWTEGCAIVDSLTVAFKLWQLTGKNEYLEDAQLILFNALLANQKGGDFGTNNCVGPNDEVFLKDGALPIAPFCCSVWGGKGFARTMQYGQFLTDNGVVITVVGNNTITARLPGGSLTIQQTSAYPYEGGVRFEVLESESQTERELLVFLPSWVVRDSIAVTVNGQDTVPCLADSFLVLKRTMTTGDRIDIEFEQSFRCAAPLYPHRKPGFHRYFYGALLLGVDTNAEKFLPKHAEFEATGDGCYRSTADDLMLVPVCDLRDRRDEARRSATGSVQLLFRD